MRSSVTLAVVIKGDELVSIYLIVDDYKQAKWLSSHIFLHYDVASEVVAASSTFQNFMFETIKNLCPIVFENDIVIEIDLSFNFPNTVIATLERYMMNKDNSRPVKYFLCLQTEAIDPNSEPFPEAAVNTKLPTGQPFQ